MTFQATWGCASDFLYMLPKFKMATRGQLQKILWVQKLKNLKVRNSSNFTITFPTIWRCAGCIFKVLLKFKMAATDQLQFFWGHKNSKYQFRQFVEHVDVQFFFKDATKIQNGRQKSTSKFFVGAKTLKLKVRNYSDFTITFPTIWRCAGDFFRVLQNFKMAAKDQLQFFGGS